MIDEMKQVSPFILLPLLAGGHKSSVSYASLPRQVTAHFSNLHGSESSNELDDLWSKSNNYVGATLKPSYALIMRLLNVCSLTFEDFHQDVPKYVITSHRWSAGNEAMISDIKSMHNTGTSGYKKVEGFARFVREHIGYVDWLWIDTCCVNQDSSQEVNEAVNSMFRWYSDSELCLAYLADVDNAKDMDQFRESAWFRRGWTLQELVAPSFVVFLSKSWQVIGCKGKDKYTKSELSGLKGPALEQTIATITGVPQCVLLDYNQSKRYTVEEKLDWIVGRDTTKSEDMYYSLLGIFEVRMSLSYGEGANSARQRLLRKIQKIGQQAVQFEKIVKWLSPPDPWTNYASAHQYHEPHTGSWFLQSDQYRRWKDGQTRHLWLYGKAGCGKTVLSSTVIENVQIHCESAANTALVVFYFSFSDGRKQSFESLLLSLVAQLGRKEPGRSMLQREYNKPNRSLPAPAALEEILISSIGQYNEVFLALDALDECPESEGFLQNMLNGLERLSGKASNLKILATSRELREIHDCMQSLGANAIPMSTRPVDADIGRYVENELSRDRKLSRLDGDAKTLIMDTFAEKSDGMFRWAYCQLQELKKLKSTKPKYVQAALFSLPATLDATYERMLTRIEDMFRLEALTLLRWVAYAQSPLSLGELAEAAIIDPTGEGNVDVFNRGDLEDTMDILSGLITVEKIDSDDDNAIEEENSQSRMLDFQDSDTSAARYSQQIWSCTRVRLAHFSVKEYLESKRILQSSAKDFYFHSTNEHWFLAQSCLTYIMHYSSRIHEKTLTNRDLQTFPLLEYASRSWYYHSYAQQNYEIGREVLLLNSEEAMHDWLLLCRPDSDSWECFGYDGEGTGSGLYYASFLGLQTVVAELLSLGSEVNARGGMYGTALAAASDRGHTKIAKMLIEAGANVNMLENEHGTALAAASGRGHIQTVKLLLERGADVNSHREQKETALSAASGGGYIEIVKLLLDNGAEISAQGDWNGTALTAASGGGYIEIVKLLLNNGAEINAQGDWIGTALTAASGRGYIEIVKLLLDSGAEINAQGDWNGTALITASHNGHIEIVKLLLDNGAEINVQGDWIGTALTTASRNGHIEIIKLLLKSGADVNRHREQEETALSAALENGYTDIARLLLDNGADIIAQGGKDGTVLTAISSSRLLSATSNNGRMETAKLLLDSDADVNTQGCLNDTALTTASANGNVELVKLLLDNGADVNAQGDWNSTALTIASCEGHMEIVKLLLNNGADVNAQSGWNSTALVTALENGYTDIARLLLNNGADINKDRGFQKDTPLIHASGTGKTQMVRFLLDNGADVNAWEESGETALGAASGKGYIVIVRLLLDSGANVNAHHSGEYHSTALGAALVHGYLKIAKLLLERGADVNAQGDQDCTALTYASNLGDIQTVRFLLKSGADVNGHREQETALSAASGGGYIEIVKLLLDSGAEINAQGDWNGTALTAASRNGHTEIMKLLFKSGADVNGHREQETALSAASGGGYIEIVKLLLDNGAKINAQDSRNGTALTAASGNGHVEIVKMLLNNSAEVDTQGDWHDLVADTASDPESTEMTRLLLDNGGYYSHATRHNWYGNAIVAASAGGHIEIVRELLYKGANVNTTDDRQTSALSATSRCGHIGTSKPFQASRGSSGCCHMEIFELLLAKGANVNHQGGYYGTALIAASVGGHVRFVELLLKNGAKINIQTGRYGTALCAASLGGHNEIVRLLLDRGADLNIRDGSYGTALGAASYGGHIEIVRHLLHRGAEVNTAGGDYSTALGNASRRGHIRIVELLLRSGVDLNVYDKWNGTALSATCGIDHTLITAYDNDYTRIIKLLLNGGADVNVQGGPFGNALQAASYSGHKNVVEMLLERGAGINAQGGEYGSALQAASYSGHEKVAEMLIERGAEINDQGGRYSNALQAASERGHKKIVEMLELKGAFAVKPT